MPEFIKMDSVFSTQKKNFASSLLDPKNAYFRKKNLLERIKKNIIDKKEL